MGRPGIFFLIMLSQLLALRAWAGPEAEPVDDLERFIEKISDGTVTNTLDSPPATCDSRDGNAAPWVREGWKAPLLQRIGWKENLSGKQDCRKFTHEFTPTFVVSRKAGWTEAMIRDHLGASAEIYAQCGIRVGTTQVYWVDETPLGLDLTTDTAAKLTFRTPVEARPLVYFVRVPGTSYNSMSKKNENMTAYAYARMSLDKVPEEQRKFPQDTAYMGYEIRSNEYRSARSRFGRYDTVAHELAHILCNCDHVSGPEPNLLQDYQGLVSPKVKPSQCDAFKKSPLVRPLKQAKQACDD